MKKITPKEKADLLVEMGQCGFMLYESTTDEEVSFTLKKFPTPKDPRKSILLDDSVIVPSYDAGLEKAADLIGWKFVEEEIPEEQRPWVELEVNYNTGLGPSLQKLGSFQASSRKDADKEAKKRIQDFLDKGHFTANKTWKQLNIQYAIRPLPMD